MKSEYVNVNGKLVNSDCKIEVGENKKRVNSKSWLRYNDYYGSKNVGEFLENGGSKEDLRWDDKKGFLKILEVFDIKNKKVIKLEESK